MIAGSFMYWIVNDKVKDPNPQIWEQFLWILKFHLEVVEKGLRENLRATGEWRHQYATEMRRDIFIDNWDEFIRQTMKAIEERFADELAVITE